jgi:hypothetical protein
MESKVGEPNVSTLPGGTPDASVIAGRRGVQDDASIIALVDPQSGGLTSKASPSIFFYLKQATDKRVEFTLTGKDATDIEPAYEATMPNASAGLYRVDLSEGDTRLTPNKDYEIVVTIVEDATNPSHNVVSVGSIKYVADVHVQGNNVAGSAAPKFWFDAFEDNFLAIQATPTDSGLLQQRAKLLQQPDVTLASLLQPGSDLDHANSVSAHLAPTSQPSK